MTPETVKRIMWAEHDARWAPPEPSLRVPMLANYGYSKREPDPVKDWSLPKEPAYLRRGKNNA